MDNYYTRFVDNLGKLKRNEQQMNREQRRRYEKPLRKLKQMIADDATRAMKDFLVGGCLMLTSDEAGHEDFQKRLSAILKEKSSKAQVKAAGKILFETYDEEEFMKALLPLRWRIWYEAYGPVWLSHCKETGDPAHPYTNDIIGMEWDAKDGLWVKKDNRSFTVMLPPTRELLEAAYKEDRELPA